MCESGAEMNADKRLVEYFIVAGVESKGNGERGAISSSASLPPPTSPLSAVTEGEDGKIKRLPMWMCVCAVEPLNKDTPEMRTSL